MSSPSSNVPAKKKKPVLFGYYCFVSHFSTQHFLLFPVFGQSYQPQTVLFSLILLWYLQRFVAEHFLFTLYFTQANRTFISVVKLTRCKVEHKNQLCQLNDKNMACGEKAKKLLATNQTVALQYGGHFMFWGAPSTIT